MSRERVLVVDDDPQIVGLLKRVLEQNDFAVLTASDGECGWTTVCEEHPSVIVTDVMMPKLDGFELVRRVRADPLVGATPLIILSAKAEEEDQIKGLELGADDYLVKPFSLDVFLARVRAVLRRRAHLVARAEASAEGPFASPGLNLLADCTFENLVVGRGNRRAVDAARAVVANPGRLHNPFFVFGEPGRGKTHLIASMANAMHRAHRARILYLTSEIFSQQILEAYERRTVDRLRAGYLASDVLFIDDIQFLAVSPSMQTVASGIFSEMYRLHRQVVISGDRRPEELPALTEEISAGFAAGLVVGIEAPDAELRARILRSKAVEKGWPVPLELLDELARTLDSDVRTLEGAAKRLVAMKVLDGVRLDGKAVERAIASVKDTTAPPSTPPVAASRPRGCPATELPPGCAEAAIAWGTPEEMAAIVPQATTTTIVVLGISAPLVTDTVDCLAGLRHDQSTVPEGERWASAVHPDVSAPEWVIVGTNCWAVGDDLSWAVAAGPAPVYLVVLDSAGGRVMEARRVVASIPRGSAGAVAVVFGGMGVGATQEVRERLSASMRRLFRVPPEVPVIVSVAVTRPEARRWLEVALHGEDASSAR